MRKFFTCIALICTLFVQPISVSASEINTNSSLEVTEYNLETGNTVKKSYFIDPTISSTYSNNSNQTRDIIGSDEREPVDFASDLPSSAVGLLKIKYVKDGNNYTSKGTGFLVAPNLVLTAGHCVKSAGTETPSSITFSAGINYDGTSFYEEPVAISDAEVIVMPTEWSDNYDPNYDWALLKLSKPLGKTIGYLSCESIIDLVDTNIDIYGYPLDYYTEEGAQQVVSFGKIRWNDYYQVAHDADTENGQSGAPILKLVLTDDSYYYQVVGIHTKGKDNLLDINSGVRMNAQIIGIINQNWSIYD